MSEQRVIEPVGSFRVTTEPKGKRGVVRTGVVHVRRYVGTRSGVYGVDARNMGWGVGGCPGSRTPEEAIKHSMGGFGFTPAKIERL